MKPFELLLLFVLFLLTFVSLEILPLGYSYLTTEKWSLNTNNDGILRKRHPRATNELEFMLWPNGEIPYSFNSSLLAEEKCHIERAMYDIMWNSCIRFRMKSQNDTDGIDFDNVDEEIMPELVNRDSHRNRWQTTEQKVSADSEIVRDDFSLYLVTYNLNRENPTDNLTKLFDFDVLGKHDIYVIASQELAYSSLLRSGPYFKAFNEIFHKRGYVRLTRHRVMLSSVIIYVPKNKISVFYDIRVLSVTTDISMRKGGIGIRLYHRGISFAFIGAHFDAEGDYYEQRLKDHREMFSDRFKDGVLDHDYVFFMGDLNFRIDNLTNQQVYDEILIAQSKPANDTTKWNPLLRYDQLNRARSEGKAFSEFDESQVTFAPTFKFHIGTDSYNWQKHKPSFTSRILHRTTLFHRLIPYMELFAKEVQLRVSHYDSLPQFLGSDQKPVRAVIHISNSAFDVNRIFKEKTVSRHLAWVIRQVVDARNERKRKSTRSKLDFEALNELYECANPLKPSYDFMRQFVEHYYRCVGKIYHDINRYNSLLKNGNSLNKSNRKRSISPNEIIHVVQGDILIRNNHKSGLPTYPNGLFQTSAINPLNSLLYYNITTWTNGIIPYELDSSLEAHKCLIENAMLQIMLNTCIRFRPRNDRDTFYVRILQDPRHSCYAYIGMDLQNYITKVSLPEGCLDIGTVVHELMHTIGFYHHQNRQDRDQHVKIHDENIQPNMSRNFDLNDPLVEQIFTPWDYDSVMLYGAKFFSKDNQSITMEPTVPGVVLKNVYDKEGLSKLDAIAINQLYKCPNVSNSKFYSDLSLMKPMLKLIKSCNASNDTKSYQYIFR